MIKKLDIKNGGLEDLLNCIKKTNELVDAVNVLQCKNVHIESDLQDLMYPKEIKGELGENVHAVCPAVKYMGKVCRFWNGDNGKKFKNIGVLIEILSADNKRRYTCASKPKKHFEFCEPVKPDDDIIYKGE